MMKQGVSERDPKNFVRIPFSGGDEGFLECRMRGGLSRFWGEIWDLWACHITPYLLVKQMYPPTHPKPTSKKSDMEAENRPHKKKKYI